MDCWIISPLVEHCCCFEEFENETIKLPAIDFKQWDMNIDRVVGVSGGNFKIYQCKVCRFQVAEPKILRLEQKSSKKLRGEIFPIIEFQVVKVVSIMADQSW